MTAATLWIVFLGCATASAGTLRYNMFGLGCQIAAVIAESSRLVLVQVLLRDIQMNPLISIYYYAPVCLVLLAVALPFLEGAEPFLALRNLGWPILLANGILAFALNVSAVVLIGASGSIVQTLSGILKDIVLIALSPLILGSSVPGQQVFGYGIALIGLLLFKERNRVSARLQNNMSWPTAFANLTPSKRGVRVLLALGTSVAGISVAILTTTSPGTMYKGIKAVTPVSVALDPVSFTRSLRYTAPINIHQPPLPLGEGSSQTQFPIHGSAEQLIPAYDPKPDPSELAPFAWVMVLNVDQLPIYSEVLSHINCYCLRLGIPLYVDWVLHDNDRHFFTARHYNLVKYLRRHQWVMFTDGDMLIADSAKDPRDLAAQATEDVDVILSDRGGAEVCACAYIVRNSPGGWSFLRRWIAWSGEPDSYNPNWDNGDLNEMLLSGIRSGFPASEDGSKRLSRAQVDALFHSLSEEEKRCSNLDIIDHYVWVFLQCFGNAMKLYRSRELWKPWWTIRIFEWSTVLPPTTVRVYREFGGFTRTDPNHSSGHYPKRIDTDFLYHLHKDSKMSNSSMTLCTGQEWAFEPAATDQEFREWVHGYHDQSYHKCWDELGAYHCGDEPYEGWGG